MVSPMVQRNNNSSDSTNSKKRRSEEKIVYVLYRIVLRLEFFYPFFYFQGLIIYIFLMVTDKLCNLIKLNAIK